jgi:hypothetical protein
MMRHHSCVYADPALVDSFLLTHGMFSTSDQVMALLKKRFTVPLPRDTANKDLQDRYYQAKVLPVRLRVFNMAKHWIDRYSHRCLDDERFMKEVDDLTHIMLDAGMEKVAATLKHSIQRQKEGTHDDPLTLALALAGIARALYAYYGSV